MLTQPGCSSENADACTPWAVPLLTSNSPPMPSCWLTYSRIEIPACRSVLPPRLASTGWMLEICTSVWLRSPTRDPR